MSRRKRRLVGPGAASAGEGSPASADQGSPASAGEGPAEVLAGAALAPEQDSLLVDAFALSDLGAARENNEDACAILRGPGTALTAVVADGVGGGPAGERASRMAVEVMLRALASPPAAPLGEQLLRAAQQAAAEVHAEGRASPALQGMATTLTAVAVARRRLFAVHVGDSRLYLVRDGLAIQLTRDHTLAAEQIRKGRLPPGAARAHPACSVLTRALGRAPELDADRLSRPLRPGDVLISCTDGLHGVLRDGDLVELAARGATAEVVCRSLIERANARATPDNVTAAVLRVVDPTAGASGRGGLRRRLRGLLGR